MNHRDIVFGRKRLRYSDTPPTSPDLRPPPRPPVHGARRRGLPPRGDPQRGRDQLPSRRTRPHDQELRTIFTGLNVPDSVFERLENGWLNLKVEVAKGKKAEDLADARGKEIATRCQQIHDMRVINEELTADLGHTQEQLQRWRRRDSAADLNAERAARKEDTRLIESLEKENEELKQSSDFMMGLLKANTKEHENKRVKMEGMAKELASLRQMVDAKDRSINTMGMQLNAIALASPDQMLALALEAQAQRTLGMVQGLQAEIAEKAETIKELEGMLYERDIKIEAANEQTIAVEAAELRAQAAEQRAVAAEKRAADVLELAESQQTMIEDLNQRGGNMRS